MLDMLKTDLSPNMADTIQAAGWLKQPYENDCKAGRMTTVAGLDGGDLVADKEGKADNSTCFSLPRKQFQAQEA